MEVWCAYFFAVLGDFQKCGHEKNFWHIRHTSKQFSTLFDIIHVGYLVYLKIYFVCKENKYDWR